MLAPQLIRPAGLIWLLLLIPAVLADDTADTVGQAAGSVEADAQMPTLGIIASDSLSPRRKYRGQALMASHAFSRHGVNFDIMMEFINTSNQTSIEEMAMSLMSQGAIALLYYESPSTSGSQSHQNVRLMYRISGDYQIPVMVHNVEGFTPLQDANSKQHDLLLALMPTYRQQMAAVAALVEHNAFWGRRIVFSDEWRTSMSSNTDLVPAIFKSLDPLNLNESVSGLARLIDYNPFVTDAIFVMTSGSTASELLDVLEQANLTNPLNVFIFSIASSVEGKTPIAAPPGSYALQSSVAPGAVIELGVEAFGYGLQEAAEREGDDTPPLNDGAFLYGCMKEGNTGRSGDIGFDEDGQLVSASMEVYYYISTDNREKIGDWYADEGLVFLDSYQESLTQPSDQI